MTRSWYNFESFRWNNVKNLWSRRDAGNLTDMSRNMFKFYLFIFLGTNILITVIKTLKARLLRPYSKRALITWHMYFFWVGNFVNFAPAPDSRRAWPWHDRNYRKDNKPYGRGGGEGGLVIININNNPGRVGLSGRVGKYPPVIRAEFSRCESNY